MTDRDRTALSRLCARLLPAPDYCGEITERRLFGPVKLRCVGDRRYLEIKPLGVWRRV